MHQIFLSIGEAHLDPWRSHRMFSACRTFARHVDPEMTAKAEYLDCERQGWTFYLTTAETRDQLATFHDRLRGKVQTEQPSQYHPVEVGAYDAAQAIFAG